MSSEGIFETTSSRPKAERSVTALLADLVNEIGLLMRHEMALLRTELGETVSRAGRGAAVMAAGGICALGGFLVLLAAAVLGLATVLPPWLSAVIVGAVFVGLGAALLLFGRRRFTAEALAPRRTLNALREDQAWLKERVR
jgi:hypothetical protein